MAIEIRAIPVLEGEAAERFVLEAEVNESKPKTYLRTHFSKEIIERMITGGEELRKRIDRGEVQLR